MREIKFKFPRNAGGNAKYDWDTILNGKTWELTQGEDFEMEPRTFVAHCHGTAKRRDKRVRTHSHGKVVVVQAFKDKSEKAPKIATVTEIVSV